MTLTIFAFVIAPEADRTTLITINGTPYRIVEVVEARSDCKAKWVPIITVQEIGTALKSKSLTKSLTGQP